MENPQCCVEFVSKREREFLIILIWRVCCRPDWHIISCAVPLCRAGSTWPCRFALVELKFQFPEQRSWQRGRGRLIMLDPGCILNPISSPSPAIRRPLWRINTRWDLLKGIWVARLDFLLGVDLDLIRADSKLGLGDEAHHDTIQQIRLLHNKLKLKKCTHEEEEEEEPTARGRRKCVFWEVCMHQHWQFLYRILYTF